jgi:chemotaxis protein methyltransferase CheR
MYPMTTSSTQPQPWSAEDFRPVADLIRARQGDSFPSQRLTLVQARLQSRLRSRGIPSFSWFYSQVLMGEGRARGLQLLIDASTVNHSSFFREPATLEFLVDHLSMLIRERPARVWTAGCSAGQEPYSVAMLLEESAPGFTADSLEIVASDLSREILRMAVAAIYDEKGVADISDERLRRFFLRGRGPRRGTIRVAPEVRRLVSFLRFDLRSSHWPIQGPFDVILCRNVTLYFPEAERVPTLERMAEMLRPDGLLALGSCEILPSAPRMLDKVAPSVFRRASP